MDYGPAVFEALSKIADSVKIKCRMKRSEIKYDRIY